MTTEQRLRLRRPQPRDEAQVRAAQKELASDGFDFMLAPDDLSWSTYLERVDRDRQGLDLAPGRVPATMLLAVVGDEMVGRVHIRHELTPELARLGGHIGYGVRPTYRQRGYATEMLRQGLEVLAGMGVDQVLVTCDEDNVASARTIEANGGVLENVEPVAGEPGKRRYWIATASVAM